MLLNNIKMLKKIQKFRNKIEKKAKKFLAKKNKKSRWTQVLGNLNNKKFSKKRNSLKIDITKIKFPYQNNTKYIPYLFIVIIIIFVIFIVVITGPIFRVKNIEITRLDSNTNMNIAYSALEDFRWDNIFNIREQELFNQIKNYQDNLNRINLNIVMPDTLEIEIWSFPEIYNVVIDEKNYSLLQNWSLIPKNRINEELRNLKIEKDYWDNIFLEYRKIFSQEYLEKIIRFDNLVRDNVVDLQIKEMVYYELEREFHMITQNDVILMFSLDWISTIEDQIRNLVIFDEERQDISNWDLYYVDLRIRNKIFYCLNENANQCESNIKNTYFQ